MNNQSGILSEGARRVWRYQRALWWLFAVNFILTLFGTAPLAFRLGAVADHSLQSQALSQRFDVFAFFELAGNPDVALWSKFSGSFLFALIFFVFALFLTGGILEAYRSNRRLPVSEFFAACGTFFWRWVRLLVFMLIVLAPVAFLASGISKWSGTLSADSPQEKLGFWVDVVGLGSVLFLLMAIRLWFDMAQVRAVAENERAMRRSFVRGFRLTFGNFGTLFWVYFRISLLSWLALVVAIWIWLRLPAQAVGSSFFLFQLVLLWWTGARLWQRASETVWYERHVAAVTVPAAMPWTEPLPAADPVTPPSSY